ncbi:hypothetical protein PF010_g12273 [Phytophthora fragariae]|nr:hypothetical protein PF010_g12273 [Phytophthora fragariae]
MDNVAQGMINIGQAWATAPSRYVIPMDGTMGQTNVIPGIASGFGVATIMSGGTETAGAASTDVQAIALFTNPQGIYNKYSVTWEPPPGHLWNRKYWYEPRKTERRRAPTAEAASSNQSGKPAATPAKRNREQRATSDSEPEASPRPKKVKAAVKQADQSRGRSEEQRPPGARREAAEHEPADEWHQHVQQVRAGRPLGSCMLLQAQMLRVWPIGPHGSRMPRQRGESSER